MTVIGRSGKQYRNRQMGKALWFAAVFSAALLTLPSGCYAADKSNGPGPAVTILWSPEIRSAAREPETERNTMSETEVNAMFYVSEITDDIFARIKGRSYKDNCTVPLSDLRYLHLLHKDINGVIHEGEMICSAKIAEDVLAIFRELYDAGYPIEKVRLVDEYDADDERSMADNNCSSFNYRTVSYTTKLSNHALGLAVDINPLYNPYIKTLNGKPHVEPANAVPYTDRAAEYPYKLTEGDLCYRLFTEHGFTWGGHWQSCKDYQHFEKVTD